MLRGQSKSFMICVVIIKLTNEDGCCCYYLLLFAVKVTSQIKGDEESRQN